MEISLLTPAVQWGKWTVFNPPVKNWVEFYSDDHNNLTHTEPHWAWLGGFRGVSKFSYNYQNYSGVDVPSGNWIPKTPLATGHSGAGLTDILISMLNVTLGQDFLFTIFTQLTELSSAGCRRRFSSVSDWISERKSPRLTKFSRLLIATFRMFLLKSFNRLVAIEFQSSSSRPRSSSMHAFNRDTMIVVII